MSDPALSPGEERGARSKERRARGGAEAEACACVEEAEGEAGSTSYS